MTIDLLAGQQNPDGGWPYVRGISWVEPTAYSVLAMLAAGDAQRAAHGIQWLRHTQRPDGGFPPQPGIEESSWLTALVALLPPDQLGDDSHRSAVQWLLGTTGQESTTAYRLREWLMGQKRPADQKFPGWPWIPGTAAWVGPTSLAILALEKESRRNSSSQIAQRVAEGRGFLQIRMCTEGGWNHGSAHALGYDSRPYPETTGIALAALRGVDTPDVRRSIDKAAGFLDDCRSADALNWLHLGLMAHDKLPADYQPPAGVVSRTVAVTAMQALVEEARKGRNPFWA